MTTENNKDEKVGICRVRIKGEHFYTDSDMFLNFYGVDFFSCANELSLANPYIPDELSGLPGIIDDFLEPIKTPEGNEPRMPVASNTAKMIYSTVSHGYIKKRELIPKFRPTSFDMEFPAEISLDDNGNVVISYGNIIKNTLYIADGVLSAHLPLSPLCNVSISKKSRVMHTEEFPLSKKGIPTDEAIDIDFAVTSNNLNIEASCGRIEFDYELEVYGTVCEKAIVRISICPPEDK